MEHVAIMKKSWGLLPKIQNGQKTIESRWLVNRSAPWDKVAPGDTVYFKNSSEPIKLKARVADVQQFDQLTPDRIHDILKRYGAADGIHEVDLPYYERLFRNKRYCVLVFLQDIQSVEPFTISKHGYGLQAAWLTYVSVRANL